LAPAKSRSIFCWKKPVAGNPARPVRNSRSFLMKRRLLFAGIFAFALLPARADDAAIAWQPWSGAAFAQAAREHKLVLLDLEAVWCHWCHVMDAESYHNPQVVALMNRHYIAVRVDQDSRPDLASRYEDYGWPATIVFAADGSEIVRRRGFLPPDEMIAMLQAIIDDPTPGPSVQAAVKPNVAGDATIPAEKLAAWRVRVLAGYDTKLGGWGMGHKFLDWDNVEYAMEQAGAGDARFAAMAKEMLVLQRKLIDPAWGGVYQYSAEGDWDHPHFEKIMQMQAEDMRIYAQAYSRWGQSADLQSARDIYRYLRTFLTSPDGVVYTSQDADLVDGQHAADYFALDDAGRRARGIPRIDTHIYARENGWAIRALAEMYAATGEESFLDEAERAAQWILAHRAFAGGGFRHDEHDPAGPYLGDTLAMGRAFLQLYAVTGDRAWLAQARAAADFIAGHFRAIPAGWATADLTNGARPVPEPEFDENVALSRFANLLARFTGEARYRAMAAHALRWLAAPEVERQRGSFIGGLLLAEVEFSADPLHIAVVGRKDDPVARQLFAAALRAPDTYRLIEWWDRREGPAPRGEDIYPELPRATAFICANGACSSPVFDGPALSARLKKLLAEGR
jgi:uncharacterized protein YyaL (SSP411 family)